MPTVNPAITHDPKPTEAASPEESSVVRNGVERLADRPTARCRRPLRSRETGWARGLARFLRRTPLTPNAISILGIVFSGIGFTCLALTVSRFDSPVLFLIAAGMVQLRLLCNLMDGLVAIEGGRRSPTGDLFNEAPDRMEDALFLAGAGIAASFHPWGLTLGWLSALAALATAYVRVLGVSLGADQDFSGPFAKPQRMFFLTVGCLGAFFEAVLRVPGRVLPFVLALIAAGSLLTLARRLARLHTNLKGEGRV